MRIIGKLLALTAVPMLVVAAANFGYATNSTTPPPVNLSCAGPCPLSNIKHVIIIVQENHTFDNHFGRYCQAAPGSNPSGNIGPGACEAAPAKDPSGAPMGVLTDKLHGDRDPNHDADCEIEEVNGGKMDKFASAECGGPGNVVAADQSTVKPYWELAAGGAIADHYFQAVMGASSSNDMYLARAGYVFKDNDAIPKGAIGTTCSTPDTPQTEYSDATIGDLLNNAGVSWKFYAEGYQRLVDAVQKGACPTPPPECNKADTYPCIYDPSDVPFQYYRGLREDYMRDLNLFKKDLDDGTLPAVSYIKALGYRTEHPGGGNTLTDGVQFVTGIVDAVENSQYRGDTLILITWDESGGYYDHVAPPPPSKVDGQPYGPRIPFIAVGPFARKNYVSHVVMEHSSIVRFIEWNWLGGTGQLGTRDAAVNNIGSLLDPATTGVAVPEN